MQVYATALRALQDHLGADTPLAVLDEARTGKHFGGWFGRRYGPTARATQVRQLAILRSACAFWRLLYETAARPNEILSLDIEDLDVPNKRARVRSKGGAVEWVFWQTGAALLLPRLLAGRTTGPVFLADRQPTRAVPTVDRCPSPGARALVLPPRGRVIQRCDRWVDAPSVAALRLDPRCRGRDQYPDPARPLTACLGPLA